MEKDVVVRREREGRWAVQQDEGIRAGVRLMIRAFLLLLLLWPAPAFAHDDKTCRPSCRRDVQVRVLRLIRPWPLHELVPAKHGRSRRLNPWRDWDYFERDPWRDWDYFKRADPFRDLMR